MKHPRLGQHFLKNDAVVRRMAEVLPLTKSDTVLEIGPGKGVLTEELLQRAGKVIAVEKDATLVTFLQEKFASEIESEQLLLIAEDVRSFTVSDYLTSATSYSVVANIPYYITGEIIRTFLTSDRQPHAMALLVQKEVAERITTRGAEDHHKESLLSISVKAYGTPHYVATVKAGSFAPPPKVDSAILTITDISRNNFKNKKEEDFFFATVRAGFAHKRKMLRKNLEQVADEQAITDAFAHCSVQHNARAEEMGLNMWLCLSRNLRE